MKKTSLIGILFLLLSCVNSNSARIKSYDTSSSSSSYRYIDDIYNRTTSALLIEKNEFTIGEQINIWVKIVFKQRSFYLPLDTEFVISDINERSQVFLDDYEFLTPTTWTDFMINNTYKLGPFSEWWYTYIYFKLKIVVSEAGIHPIYKYTQINFDRTLNSKSTEEGKLNLYREYYCYDWPDGHYSDIGFYMNKNQEGFLYFYAPGPDQYGFNNVVAEEGTKEYDNFFVPYAGPMW
jgi:hypothetical protein